MSRIQCNIGVYNQYWQQRQQNSIEHPIIPKLYINIKKY
uniref:Uncharacterized protein n=1 Tax=Anguilla anguilla TaxID=7936 RepID=A0A0E9R575_ANGAN